ncbi:MAG: CoB--CoM heterodisulfide reductase iron-sulfur subunit B family protein [Oscillospiraceae bacterium]|nr:CoB--CoM heterodisulfide reductase iron-sulfur subunit B family protein [Oscillospiraceae bacterium]
MLKYAYFPGCAMDTTGTTYRLSIEYVCSKIGMELLEIPDWNCCGATSAHSKGKWLGLALPARNIALSEQHLPGLDICVPCASCYSRMKIATNAIRGSKETKEKLSYMTESPLEGKAEVVTLMEVLCGEEGLKAVKKAIIRPLDGLKAACYYGCLTSRPQKETGAENIENPDKMDRLIALTGIETVMWDYKTECCGASHQVDAPDASRVLIERILRNAKSNGARAVVTACPLCNLNLDMREEEINKSGETAFDLPVYQFTQLLAVAMGASAKDIGLHKHFYPAFDRIDEVFRKAAVQK